MTEKPGLDLLQGTLDLLVLRVLQAGPQHGWGIAQRLQVLSEEVLRVNQGSLYPALYRLVRLRHVTAEWGTSENNRKARFYRITAGGRKRLEEDASLWRRVSSAVTAVLDDQGALPETGGAACAG